MRGIAQNCGQHMWGLQDFDNRTRQALRAFQAIHPPAVNWKLGLFSAYGRRQHESLSWGAVEGPCRGR